jgi:hypothetical protein
VKGQAFSKAAAAVAAGRLPPKASTRGKLSSRAKSVRVHVGGNCFLVFSRFFNRPSLIEMNGGGELPRGSVKAA